MGWPRHRRGVVVGVVSLKVIQQMLGHSSATMTLDTYGHVSKTLGQR